MWEFTIYDRETKEEDIIMGYSFKDAMKRCGITEEEVKSGKIVLLRQDYMD